MKSERRERGHEGKSPKQSLNSAKDLPMELHDECESPYHKLN